MVSFAAVLGLAGCPDGVSVRSAPSGKPSSNPTGASLSGGLTSGGTSVPASEGATASPATQTSAPASLTSSPPPTAGPRVAVAAVVVNPPSALLYLPARDASGSLGLPTSTRFDAYAERADGLRGAVRWTDRSGGLLAVGATGLVTVTNSASARVFWVRAEAVDDPAIYVEVPVEVRTTGELGLVLE